MKTNRSKTALLFIGLACFSFKGSAAPALNVTKMDSFITALSSNNKFMGSIAISRLNNIVYTNTTGNYNITDNQNFTSTNNTKYRIGAVSKMFTATIIFQLLESRQLTLDTTLAVFFPEMPNADKITIAQLLYHRSGLHNFTESSAYPKWVSKNKAQARMLKMMSKQKPDFEPDEKSGYSNANYVMLGYIIEKVTGKTYAQAVEERIVKPLALKNTYFATAVDLSKMEATSYNLDNDTWKHIPDTGMNSPAGASGIVSTPTDMCIFMNALFTDQLVKRVSLKTMMTLKDNAAIALFPSNFYEKRLWGNTGRVDGFNASVIYIPQDSVAISYCSNGLNYDMNEILRGILSIYYNKPYQFPSFNAILLSQDELKKFEGMFASTELPLKIKLKRDGNHLVSKASSQSAYNLEAIAENKFQYTPEGIKIEFTQTANGDYNQFILNQLGREFTFTKQIKENKKLKARKASLN